MGANSRAVPAPMSPRLGARRLLIITSGRCGTVLRVLSQIYCGFCKWSAGWACMQKQQKGVVVVGPSPLFREGLSRILKEAGFATLASASDIGGLILGSVWRTKSLLLVIDASNDSDSTVEQIVSFRKQYPSGRIAVLSERQRLRDALLLCRAGAHGYFAKVSTCEAFIKSLELIMLGEMIIPGLILSLMLAEDEKLEDRQVDDRPVDGH